MLSDAGGNGATQVGAKADWLDDDRDARRLGYIIIVFLFGFGGLWGSLAPIESAALAPGVVQVEGKRKAIQHLEGGIISEILVANGQWVEQGQTLLILDSARHTAERDIFQGRLYNQQAAVDRLKAERDNLPNVAFRSPLLTASAEDSRASNAISSERELFAARSADRLAEQEVLASKKKGLELVLESKQSLENSLRQEILDLQDLLAEGYVDKQRLRQLERSRTQIIGELADLQVSIDEIALRVSQSDKRFKTEVVDELAETLEALYDVEQQYLAADDRVQRAHISAPVAGTVLNLVPNTIGGVVSPGNTLLEIVPNIESLVVDAKVSPMDIDRVTIGQPAEVRFSVFKDAYTVSGSLEKLSADRLVDLESQTAYYAAEIKLLEEDLHFLEGMTLVPGMPAEVLIKTGERTMLGYLTSPMNRVFSRSLIED